MYLRYDHQTILPAEWKGFAHVHGDKNKSAACGFIPSSHVSMNLPWTYDSKFTQRQIHRAKSELGIRRAYECCACFLLVSDHFMGKFILQCV